MSGEVLDVKRIPGEIRDIILTQLDVQIDNADLLGFDTPLYGINSGINLDSVLMVELMVVIEDRYKITFEDDVVALGQIFTSISSLSDYTVQRIELAQSGGLDTQLLMKPAAEPAAVPVPLEKPAGGLDAAQPEVA